MAHSLKMNDNCTNIDLNKSDELLNRQENVSSQPLYITIGPPCSGKTTWIRQQNIVNDIKILDICIDDQPGIYYSLPMDYFIGPKVNTTTTDNDNMNKDTIIQQEFMHPSTVLFGRTIQERLNEQTELLAVARRFASVSDKVDFRHAISSQLLVEVVEEIILEANLKQEIIVLPTTIDMFVVEAIFRRPSAPLTTTTGSTDISPSLTALQRVEQLLYDAPISIPVAYGNTNTKPSDYVLALNMALKFQRPVHFVVYYDGETLNIDNHDLSVDDALRGLIRRNVHRFLQTGRYIPSNVISDMRDRTMNMINDILLQHQQQSDPTTQLGPDHQNITRLEIHQQLARMAGFVMDDNRIITSTISNQPASKRRNDDNDRHATPTTRSMQRPWDRPANAVRGYNSQFDNQPSKRAR